MLRHTPRFACFVILAISAILPPGSASATDRVSSPIKITIDPATPLAKIPDDFIGFGYETSAVAQADFFSRRNARMIRLYTNLSPHGLIRIGGNVSDHTRFDPLGTAAAKTEREVTIFNQTNLNDLRDFARATGWKVMWGLNLGTGSRDEAVIEAVAVDKTLGDRLQSFEIGNEVDLMKKYAKDYDAYRAAYLDYKAAIRAKLPAAAFSGPDVAGNYGFVEKFVAAEGADMKLVTHHYYRGGARDPKSTLDRLFARDDGFDSRLEKLRALCAEHHLDYRINETNSFSGGGKEGVSDTLGSALWVLDYMFDLASHGCGGVNIETDINQLGFISRYSPIVHDAAGVCSAHPEYYGMLAFAMAGHGEIIKASVEWTDINLTAFASKDENGTVFLTVINKDAGKDATVECSLPPRGKAASAFRLTGPSIDTKTGVTFAGAAVAEDGSWNGGAPEVVAVTDGIARLAVPHGSAVVVKFATH
jgi:hypothetical protein